MVLSPFKVAVVDLITTLLFQGGQQFHLFRIWDKEQDIVVQPLSVFSSQMVWASLVVVLLWDKWADHCGGHGIPKDTRGRPRECSLWGYYRRPSTNISRFLM